MQSYLEDVDNIVHHGVCPAQLGPNVSEDTAMNADDVSGVKYLHPGSALVLSLKSLSRLAHVEIQISRYGPYSILSRISAVCAITIGSRVSPFACNRASISTASSHLSCVASQRGDLGIRGRKAKRTIAGIIWRPQGRRKTALVLMNDEPYEMKYIMRIWRQISHVVTR